MFTAISDGASYGSTVASWNDTDADDTDNSSNPTPWNETDDGAWNGTTWNTNDLIFTSLTSAILSVLILVTIIGNVAVTALRVSRTLLITPYSYAIVAWVDSGNVFVIAAILLERHLHSVANYLIVSLAVADLLVACLVMPLSAVYEISKKWILGPELCDMWTFSDVLCCTASILHLVAIAVDRYWAVTNVDYIHNRNGKRIGKMIFMVWTVALSLALAPLFGWKEAHDRVNITQKCMISQDVSYQIFATSTTFYVPMAVILIIYWKIFQTARQRIRKNHQAHAASINTADAVGNLTHPNPHKTRRWFRISRIRGRSVQLEGGSPEGILEANKGTNSPESSVSRTEEEVIDKGKSSATLQTTAFIIQVPPPDGATQPAMNNGSSLALTCNEVAITTPATPTQAPVAGTASTSTVARTNTGAGAQGAVRNAGSHGDPVRKKRETLEAKREKKAAKTLAIITGAFVVCWLPFFVMAILIALLGDVFNDTMASVFLWLGYMNSTLNPIIYTIFSPDFRQAFKRLLCGKSTVQTSVYRPRKLR